MAKPKTTIEVTVRFRNLAEVCIAELDPAIICPADEDEKTAKRKRRQASNHIRRRLGLMDDISAGGARPGAGKRKPKEKTNELRQRGG